MRIYELTTNEGRRFVRSDERTLRRRMMEYIRRKREAGMSLAAVVYCWSPIVVGRP